MVYLRDFLRRKCAAATIMSCDRTPERTSSRSWVKVSIGTLLAGIAPTCAPAGEPGRRIGEKWADRCHCGTARGTGDVAGWLIPGS